MIDSLGVHHSWLPDRTVFPSVAECCAYLRGRIYGDMVSIFCFSDNGKILLVSKESALVQQYLTFK